MGSFSEGVGKSLFFQTDAVNEEIYLFLICRKGDIQELFPFRKNVIAAFGGKDLQRNFCIPVSAFCAGGEGNILYPCPVERSGAEKSIFSPAFRTELFCDGSLHLQALTFIGMR